MTVDEVVSDRDGFAERVFASSLGYFDILSIHLGLRLGLYRALADGGAMTSDELASAAGIDERYAREWLEQQSTRAILLADRGAEPTRFTLPPGHAEVLLDSESPSRRTSACPRGSVNRVGSAPGSATMIARVACCSSHSLA